MTGNIDRVVEAYKINGYCDLAPEDAALYRAITARFLQGQSDYIQSSNSSFNPGQNFGGVADTYGGLTHNGLITEYDPVTGEPLRRAAWGHDTWYWGVPSSIAPTEFYAEYFSANVTGNAEELALLKEYYPTATSVADSYSNQLAGN